MSKILISAYSSVDKLFEYGIRKSIVLGRYAVEELPGFDRFNEYNTPLWKSEQK